MRYDHPLFANTVHFGLDPFDQAILSYLDNLTDAIALIKTHNNTVGSESFAASRPLVIIVEHFLPR